MKTNKFKKGILIVLLGTLVGTTSCVNDLDTVPLDKDELVSKLSLAKN